MSLLTPFLKLFKWNTEDTEDLEQPFDIKKAMNENWDKLDTKAQEQEKKISDIADNIEDIQTKDTEQDKLIQKLQSNMINESTEEATSIYVEDASNVPAVLQIEGNHYQETQEGTSNLAVLNEGTITQDGITIDIKDGVATMSGSNTSDTITYIVIGTAYLYAGQTYYLNVDRQQSSGSSGFSLKSGETISWFTAGTEKAYECTKTGEYEIRVSFGVSTVQNIGTFKVLISKTLGSEWVQGKKTIPSVEYPSPNRTVGDNINILPNEATSQIEGNLEWTVNSDGSVHVVGTASSNALFLKKGTNNNEEVFRFKTNKIYKNVGNVDIIYRKIDGSYARKLKGEIFSYGEDEVINQLYLQVPSGQTVDEIYYPKIVEYYEGIDESYSRYGQGSVKITKLNKNMFILPASNLLGVEVAPQEDGTYKLNGTSTTSWAYRNGEYFWISPGEYTIFAENLEELISAVFGIGTEDNSWKAEINTGIKEYTFTVTEKMKVRPYFTCSSSAVFNNNTVKVQLEKDIKTDWVKHEEESCILPIQQEMLDGDYFDLLNNKEVHNWKKVILNGTENWSKSGSTTDEIFVATLKIENAIDGYGYCNYFKYWGGIKISYFSVYNNGVNIRFCMDGAEIKTIEEFKAWLQQKNTEGNPVCVYYRLATPTKLDLTEEQKEVLQQLNNLDLFKGENNIYTEQDLALLKLDYTVDTKMYINNKISSQNQQILEIAGGN